MAEYVLRDKLKKREVEGVKVISAGVAASNGRPMTENSRIILKENCCGDPEAHRSKNIGELDLNEGDLVLAMTSTHLAVLHPYFENQGVRSALLKEYVGEPGEFPDPFGGELDRYRRLYQELEPVIEKLAEKIEAEQN
jgi:protein-tyrosine phosphatase